MIENDKDNDYPYSEEWLEQHTQFAFKRFLEEYERKQKWIASLNPIDRFFYKLKQRLFIWRMDVETWFSWHFNKEFREECIKMREEGKKRQENRDKEKKK